MQHPIYTDRVRQLRGMAVFASKARKALLSVGKTVDAQSAREHLESLLFELESIAHLQGREREIIPFVDKLRSELVAIPAEQNGICEECSTELAVHLMHRAYVTDEERSNGGERSKMMCDDCSRLGVEDGEWEYDDKELV